MAYVNGFLAPVPKDQLEAYKKTAQLFAKAAMANGALSCVESFAEGLEWGKQTSFPRAVDLKDGEVVVFSWIVYPSKAVADKGNEAIMADPDVQAAMQAMVFDGKRMVWGGFETLNMAGAGAA
jgi:uncharacterized protein YbaA (DUF1428 family)